MLLGRIVEGVVRTDGRRVLAGLIRLTGDFDAAEDALQEAYARALVVWHRDGVPATPGAWLNTVARRIAIDRLAARSSHGAARRPGSAAGRVRGAARDRGRPAAAALHVLSSRAGARGAVRAGASDAWRPDDARDRARLRRARVHHGPAARPRQAQDPRGRHSVRGAAAVTAARAHRHRARRALPDLQRGLRGHRRRLAAAARPHGRGHPPGASGHGTPPGRRGSARPAGADAADRRAPRRAHDRRPAISCRSTTRTARCGIARRSTKASGCSTPLWRCGVRAPTRRRPRLRRCIRRRRRPATPTGGRSRRSIRPFSVTRPPPSSSSTPRSPGAWPDGLSHALDGIARVEAGGELARYHLLPAAKADVLRRLGRRAEAAEAYRAALALVTNAAERRFLERRLADCSAP